MAAEKNQPEGTGGSIFQGLRADLNGCVFSALLQDNNVYPSSEQVKREFSLYECSAAFVRRLSILGRAMLPAKPLV